MKLKIQHSLAAAVCLSVAGLLSQTSAGVGLSGEGSQFWSQNSSGIYGGAEANDKFGVVLAAGDFDKNGIQDLVVGTPYEDFPNSEVDAGGVTVIYGKPEGLHKEKSQFLSQYGSDIFGVAQEKDEFGFSLAVGDFNGDGVDDLAVGIPFEDYPASTTNAGGIIIAYGVEREGLDLPGSHYLYEGDNDVGGTAHEGDSFGYSLAAGDFNKDGADDLAIGIPYYDHSGTVTNSGAVRVLYGVKHYPLGSGGSQLWSQAGDIAGSPEKDDRFGLVLASGDFNGDGAADLAVGMPYEDYPSTTSNAGGVSVIYGIEGIGLDEVDNQFWSQASGIDGKAEAEDRFGWSLAVGDFDRDGADDLAVGVPYEDYPGTTPNSGGVNILYGVLHGVLGTARNHYLALDDIGYTPAAGDRFGWSLAAGDFDNDKVCDLAIGIPYRDLDNTQEAGMVAAVYGLADMGLVSAGSQLWHQNSPDVYGVPQSSDRFGYALAAGRFDGGELCDLAIGIPFENYPSTQADAGGVTVLYGTDVEYPEGWWRGNTHTHSNRSDGEDEPEVVAATYKGLGYQFVVLTDHNNRSDFVQFSQNGFLAIEGEELNGRHINGLGLTQQIENGSFSPHQDFNDIFDAISAQGGLHQLNHPVWSLPSGFNLYTLEVLKSVQGIHLMEIYNANTVGGHPGDEGIWDILLSQGQLIFGTATDDAHHMSNQAGKGWIMVRAGGRSLTLDHVLDAIDAGDFYASTGIVLNDVRADADLIVVDSQNGETVEFIGAGGAVLRTVNAPYAEYEIQGTELYIRARVSNSNGKYAWCQPVFP